MRQHVPSMKKDGSSTNATAATVGYEAAPWQMADALRGSMDAADHNHVVLGMTFLRYISDAFEAQHAHLEAEEAEGADQEDPEECRALNISWVQTEACWPHLNAQARQPTIGQLVDDATSGIERDAPALKGALPRDYVRPALGKSRLRRLIHLIRSTGIGDAFPQALQTDAVPEVSGVRR